MYIYVYIYMYICIYIYVYTWYIHVYTYNKEPVHVISMAGFLSIHPRIQKMIQLQKVHDLRATTNGYASHYI